MIGRRLVALVLVCGGAAASLTACATSPAVPATNGSSTSTTGVQVPNGLSPAPSGVPEMRDDGSTGSPLPGSTLVLDDTSRSDAIAAATKVMALFARRGVSAEQWWHDLVPLMTAKAAQAYKDTDPANVPPTKVTEAAKVTPASTPQVARVSVPTDAGVYLVILSRTDQSPNWLTERITPPEGAGDS